MSHRRGFSMVEVLMALFIIAMLVGLVLPWLTQQRNHGVRSKSANNLKQIILACHNYNDANNSNLPPLVDQGKNAPTGGGLRSVFFNILPYVECDCLYSIATKMGQNGYCGSSSSFVYRGTWSDGSTYQQDGGSANQAHHVFVSPNDSSAVDLRDVPMTLPNGTTGFYATGSYAANGMIPWNTAGLPRTFVDGTSNTIAFGERPQVCTDAVGRTVYNLWGYGMYGASTPALALLTPDEPKGLPSTGQIAAALPLPEAWSADRMPVRIGTESAPVQPSPVPRPFQLGLRHNGPCDPRIAGSPHAGGMLVALGDGSVRSLDPKMSDWTYWAALTPDGKETPNADWNP